MLFIFDAPAIGGVPGEHFPVLRAGNDMVGLCSRSGLGYALNGGSVTHQEVSGSQGEAVC